MIEVSEVLPIGKKLAAIIKQQCGTIERRDATYTKPGEGWVCFHCGERFVEYDAAKNHFGEGPDSLHERVAELEKECEQLRAEKALLEKNWRIHHKEECGIHDCRFDVTKMEDKSTP